MFVIFFLGGGGMVEEEGRTRASCATHTRESVILQCRSGMNDAFSLCIVRDDVSG